MSTITPEAWRAAVIRIATGQSTETEEAARLKVHKSTVSRKVEKIAPTLKTAADPAAQPGATKPTPESKPAPSAGKTALEIAREAAGGIPSAEVSKAVTQAGLEDAKFCVDTLQNYKAAGVYLVAQFSGVPADEPALPRVGQLSEMAKGVIAQNASWLAPMLRAQGSKEVFYAVMAIEALLGYMAIRKLAKQYAPPPEPESRPAPEAEKKAV